MQWFLELGRWLCLLFQKYKMKVKILINWNLQKIIWTKYFIVTSEYSFLLIIYWKKYSVKVPKGFITDFWSIPSIFFFFDKSKYVSYILHDFLYSLIWEIKSIQWIFKYNQSLADEILIAWLDTEWMNETWRVLVCIWLMIWWKYNYKKVSKEISLLKQTL